MTQGKFIVIEGMEGAGKSTAIAVVEAQLNKHGITFDKTREPGGTPMAESMRELVKSVDISETVTQETELMLMYASRSQLLANKIKPSLAQGRWVLGDRHDLSSQAYQGGGRQISADIMNTMADITLKGFKPDLTLYLDVTPEIGLARARGRGELDRIEQEDLSFFERVRARYQAIAEQDDSIHLIDATQSIEAVHEQIIDVVEAFIARHD
ncbi:dTMP kinase [Thalassotalea agarivorans]|uniref:Thymidylate kinase n=1 Tax=Thalassotalea agarivorans TaxID=349064 RepID=A0A1I0EU01_THASX|nr:dTMP kinase [Thalassotalea agarivorans]SET49048.1 thymidylate kinase [Thalassotalea agarivorans]